MPIGVPTYEDNMPSLKELIQGNAQQMKQGSQVLDVSTETMEQVRQKQGLLPGAVASPQMAAAVGGTKDQAKMAGSSANLQNLIKQSVAPEQKREIAERRMQYRTEKTATEAEKQAEAERTKKLESLGQRMGTLVNQAIKNVTATKAGVGLQFDEDKFKAAKPNASPEELQLLKQAAEGGAIDAKLYGTLGITKDATAEEVKTAIQQYTKDPNQTLIAGVQTNLPEQVLLKDVGPDLEQQLGVSLSDLAALTGRTPEELQGMTVKDLQRRIDAVGQQDFSEVAALRARAEDPTSSVAAREEAQQRLRELGEAGVSATEADFQQLNQAVQSADIIRVGGREMTIGEALSDEGLAASITAALEDPKAMDKLKQDMPELASFVEKNQASLKAQAAKLDQNTQDLAKVQVENAKLATVEGVPMDDFNQAVIPGYTSGPSNTQFQPTMAHQILQGKEMADSLKQDYATFLKDIARTDAEEAKKFANMDYKQLAASGLLDRTPSGNLYLQDYIKYVKSSKALQDPNVLTDQTAAAAAVQQVFDGDLSTYQDMLDQYNTMSKYGLVDVSPESKQIADVLDSEPRDGKLDEPTKIAKKLKDLTPATWSKTRLQAKDSLDKLQSESAVGAASAGLLPNYLKDNNINADEATQLAASADADELVKLYLNDRIPFEKGKKSVKVGGRFGRTVNVPTSTKDILKDRIKQLTLPTIKSLLASSPQDAALMDVSSVDYRKQLEGLGTSTDLSYESERLGNTINYLQSQLSKASPAEAMTLKDVINDYKSKQADAESRRTTLVEQEAKAAAAEAEAARRRREEARKAQLSTSQVSDRAAANTAKAIGQNVADTLLGKKKQLKIGGTKISDARAKHSIEGIGQNDLVEFYASIKPYYYQYLDQLNGEGIIPGFMAQDLLQSKLGRTIVSEGPDGLLRVDTWKLLGALTATMKYLMEREDGRA